MSILMYSETQGCFHIQEDFEVYIPDEERYVLSWKYSDEVYNNFTSIFLLHKPLKDIVRKWNDFEQQHRRNEIKSWIKISDKPKGKP